MPAAAIVASSVIGGATAASGARASARAAQQASDTATAEQRRQFDLVRQDTAGQRALGDAALDRIRQIYGYGAPVSTDPRQQGYAYPYEFLGGFGGMRIPSEGMPAPEPATSTSTAPDMSAFFRSPDYAFNLAEGQQAIDRSAAARGGLLSGRAVKEGARFASGLASREFSGYMDRLMQQAGIGSTGIGASAAAGANAANAIGNAAMNAGAQRGSAYMAGAQGVNNAIQGGLSNWLIYRGLPQGG